MTDKTLTALTAAGTLSASDLLYGKVGSNSRKISLSALGAYFGATIFAAGSLAASAPAGVSQTWATAAGVYTGFKIAITDSGPSAAASLLIDAQVGGVSKFSVRKDGRIALSDGALATPSLGPAGQAASGWYFSGGQTLYSYFGQAQFILGAAQLGVNSGSSIGWSSSTPDSGALDLTLWRDGAANTLAQRNGTAAQTFNVYNTFTDASNGEWYSTTWAGNQAYIGTGKNGTGTARALGFLIGGSIIWDLSNTGHFLAHVDNTYDIGATASGRPRIINAATYFNLPHGADYRFNNASNERVFGAVNVITLVGGGISLNWTSASMLQFAGTTSSFPALKRSGTILQARAADDSGYAPIQGLLRTHLNATAETVVPTHTIVIYDAAGQAYRVPCIV